MFINGGSQRIGECFLGHTVPCLQVGFPKGQLTWIDTCMTLHSEGVKFAAPSPFYIGSGFSNGKSMGVEPKIGVFTIHFNRVWNPYKPSILEYPYFRKHPDCGEKSSCESKSIHFLILPVNPCHDRSWVMLNAWYLACKRLLVLTA